MISLTFGLFTQASDSGPHGPLVCWQQRLHMYPRFQKSKRLGLWLRILDIVTETAKSNIEFAVSVKCQKTLIYYY